MSAWSFRPGAFPDFVMTTHAVAVIRVHVAGHGCVAVAAGVVADKALALGQFLTGGDDFVAGKAAFFATVKKFFMAGLTAGMRGSLEGDAVLGAGLGTVAGTAFRPFGLRRVVGFGIPFKRMVTGGTVFPGIVHVFFVIPAGGQAVCALVVAAYAGRLASLSAIKLLVGINK